MSKNIVVVEKAEELPPVEEVVLTAHDRETGAKAVVNKNNMETICVVSENSKLIPHTDVYKQILDMEDFVIKKTRLLKNGRVMIIDIAERTPNKLELLPDDFIECGARIINDYGKSKGLTVQAIATRLVCSNGMVAPERSSKMNVDAFGTAEFGAEMNKLINDSFKKWYEYSDMIKEASETEMSVKDVIVHHDFLRTKYMDTITSNLEEKASLWDIYNEYTRTITHDIKTNVKSEQNLLRKAGKILVAPLGE